MKEKLIIFWNRSDFRLNDNPALYYAIETAKKENLKIANYYIFDIHFLENPVYSRRLKYLTILLEEFNKIINHNILIGNFIDTFSNLSKQYDLEIFVNSEIEPFGRKRDLDLLKLSKELNFKVNFFEDKISVNKNQLSNTGTLYSVFTPFKNKVIEDFLNSKVLTQIDDTTKFTLIEKSFDFDKLRQNILPLSITIEGEIINLSNYDKEFEYNWYKNESEVLDHFENYLVEAYKTYKEDRDKLTKDCSKMSVALKWGLISARKMKELILKVDSNPIESHYISELIWREFYKYILYNYPKVLDEEFQAKYRYKDELWYDKKNQVNNFKKWINSETGYNIVDSSMKQIIQEGYMHNRARMIVASILTKNLGVNWRYGQEYFRAMLLDLDEASNNGGWQWSASVGADPKPMRIFNPYIQQEKFDPENDFIKKYEVKKLDPIIEHSKARDATLERFDKVKNKHE
jgi:deoxyribodipyrimidine photo-lyase